MKTTIVCDDWRALHRNTLLGFATVTIQELRLTIKDIAIHEKNNKRWAQLPARPQVKDGKAITDPDTGKVQYFPLLNFTDRTVADAFSRAVIAAVLERDADAFNADAAAPTSTPQLAGTEMPF